MTDAPHGVLAEDLPESLADVVEAIGLTATLKLVERFGGIRIYIPQPEHVDADHPIAQAIGLDAARRLARIWANERPALARCADAIRRVRNRALRSDYRRMSASQTALKYQITERAVFLIVAGDESADNQASLF